MDLAYEKVDNQFIVFGLLLGAGYQSFVHGFRGLMVFLAGIGIPFFFLYLLFFFRMLGSGDIKLFSVLGGFIGPLAIAKCILWSFLFGAVISVFVILAYGNLKERLTYFVRYIHACAAAKDKILAEGAIPYYIRGRRKENIHFTVPIFMSMVMYAGGLLR